jgi:pimeloyl-ACP methyl ester carboxylesterase
VPWRLRTVHHHRDEPAAGSVTPMQAHNGDVTIEFESRGPADGETILLVMGLGAQMIAWREPFCDLLVERGFRVIRFDNRDSGLSTHTAGTPPTRAELAALAVQGARRRGARAGLSRPTARYTLSDMSDDAVAVLDAAGVRRAHVVGASLGGMIAQTMAIEHRDRVQSLTSIMSRTGSPLAGLPTMRVLRKVLRPTPTERDEAIAYELERAEVTCGPLLDREAMAGFLAEAWDRAPTRSGMSFQLAAIFASGDRTPALRRLDVPTLVIHGRDDELVRVSGGIGTARTIPGAELVVLDEMGHYLAPPLWPAVVDAIAAHVHRSAGVPVTPPGRQRQTTR